MIKCYEITPAESNSVDSTIVPAGKTWKPALDTAESVLDDLFCRMEAEGGKWSDIQVNIKCVEMTQGQLDDLEES